MNYLIGLTTAYGKSYYGEKGLGCKRFATPYDRKTAERQMSLLRRYIKMSMSPEYVSPFIEREDETVALPADGPESQEVPARK